MKRLTLPSGSSRYGAQMGRQDVLPERPNDHIKLRMERLRWVDGDYDQWGAYWGCSGGNGDIYCAWGEDNDKHVLVFVRAIIRWAAQAQVLDKIPGARFYR